MFFDELIYTDKIYKSIKHTHTHTHTHTMSLDYAKIIGNPNLESVRVTVKEAEDGNVKLRANHFQKLARCNIWLPLARDDDARVLVVEPVLRQPHKRGVFFNQEHKSGITLNICDFVYLQKCTNPSVFL